MRDYREKVVGKRDQENPLPHLYPLFHFISFLSVYSDLKSYFLKVCMLSLPICRSNFKLTPAELRTV